MAQLQIFTGSGQPTLALTVDDGRVEEYKALLEDRLKGGVAEIESEDGARRPQTYYIVPSNVTAWTFR
ncbi:hypothetical protein JOE63_002800 [Cellulosimicrobium cellulans]|uniref:hypothetical protein n=1 Tax=Cellulosimicrobium cellulans TaxID=1710 RepID=UPI0019565241|nr:hypothetical protein [Cellulosimicrobium cellulans]MBM7820323.1 hypothetical protein [Cellulosimicrobium cellulans]